MISGARLPRQPHLFDLRRAVAEDDAEDRRVREARLTGKAEAKVSPLQSGVGRRRKYVVPDWAGAVTRDGWERAVLGVVDYWLGLDKKGQIRAKGAFLMRYDGFYWYVVTAKQLAAQVYLNKKQVRRAVDRLDDAGLIRRAVHTRGGRNVAMRLRLNWPEIEHAAAEAWGSGEDDGGDD